MSLYIQLPFTKGLAGAAQEPSVVDLVAQIKAAEGEVKPLAGVVQEPSAVDLVAQIKAAEAEISLVGFSNSYEVEFPPF